LEETMMKTLLRLATFALLFSGVASAQSTGSITGIVTDGATGKPVAGVVVVATSPAVPGAQTAVTDAKGSFTVPNLPPGQYKLQTNLDGYKPETRADLGLGENVALRANLAITPEAVQLEEVVVTGSRLRRKDLTTPAPVTVINHEQIMASGKVSIAEFLQSIPEQGNSQNQNANNGGSGLTTINLRGLDANGGPRTLVLLNGRRLAAAAAPGTGAFVDLSQVPSSAIERIEILKDGSSAIYGADAIAGVVNLITRKGWSGVEVMGDYGVTSRNDGKTADVGISMGAVGERSSAFLSAGFYRQDAVVSSQRAFAKDALAYDFVTGEVSKGGSGTTPAPKVLVGSYKGVTAGLDTNSLLYKLNLLCPTHDIPYSGTGPTTGTMAACPGNYIRDANATGAYATLGWRPTTGADTFNFPAENYMVTPQQRVSLFGSADARLGSNARVYLEGAYVNRFQQYALAPEPMWGTVYYGSLIGNEESKIQAGSQYNPFGYTLDYRRRLVEADRRMATRENDSFRGVGGIEGTLPDFLGPLKGWHWDANFSYSRDVGSQMYAGNLNLNKIKDAIGPSFNGVCYANWNPALGHTAAAYSNPIANCTPVDLFGAPGSITADQLANLTFIGPSKSTSQQVISQASLSGELFTLAADRPAALAIGFEYRDYVAKDIPDPFSVAGYSSNGCCSPISGGGYHVWDAFAELNIPIVSGAPWADDLEATAAFRSFKYNLFASDQTYKLGARYRPIRDVTIRGTLATAFRAPSVAELFGGTGLSQDTASDPCDDLWDRMTPAQQQRCVNNGAPNGGPQNGPTQLPAMAGSNGGLKPEKATSYTVGVVFEPRMVNGLSLTVDYYNVAVTSPISRDGAQYVVNACVIGGVQAACDRVHRDVDGNITSIDDLLSNQGRDEVAGIDVAARYRLATEFGRFAFGVDSTFLIKHDVTKSASTGGGVVHGKGTYDLNAFSPGGGVNPAVKANFNALYGYSDASLGLSARYIGGFKECAATVTGQSSGSDCSWAGNMYHTIPAVTTFDASLGYGVTSSYGKTSATIGIQNLADTKPPVLYSNITQWGDWNYDFLGRRYYFRLVHTY
jgi:iron complex outermembrane receptor protein